MTIDEPDTGEVPVVAPPSGDAETLKFILWELQRIRYRLGILIFWFIALPIIGAAIALVVVVVSANQ